MIRARVLLQQAAFIAVLVVLGASFLYLLIEPSHWRRGCFGIGVGLLLAGVLRAVLPTAYAGMLAVRARWLDASLCLVLGAFIVGAVIRLG